MPWGELGLERLQVSSSASKAAAIPAGRAAAVLCCHSDLQAPVGQFNCGIYSRARCVPVRLQGVSPGAHAEMLCTVATQLHTTLVVWTRCSWALWSAEPGAQFLTRDMRAPGAAGSSGGGID